MSMVFGQLEWLTVPQVSRKPCKRILAASSQYLIIRCCCICQILPA